MGWHDVARNGDIADGEIVAAEADGLSLALYRINGKIYATTNLCTHDVASLSDGYIDGDCIECPLHQALFHIPTGEVRSPPATEPLKTYETKVDGDRILVLIP